MEQSLLLKIGDSVKQFANVIANVLDVDVEIADNQLVRVAGTGRFAGLINERMKSEGNAFKKVLETKKIVFVDDARFHEVCIDCPCKDICMEQCDLCCPIILKDEVIGAISLGSASEEKKKKIVENITQYSEFIENIADLIATKALEYISFQQQAHSLELLQNLVNLINDGVIIFDNDHNILFINRKTELILGNNLVQLKYLHKIKQFSIQKIKNKHSISDVEYYVRVQKRKIRLIGTIYPIKIQSEKVSQVFIFQDIESLQQNLLSNHLESFNFNYLKGNDENFLKIKEQCQIFSAGDANMLICGETGTGKEVFARAIHNESFRKNKPFVSVMCGGTVDTIVEKELFGDSLLLSNDTEIGKIELAEGGTLFIDEIGDLTLRLQGRLMNVIKKQKEYNIRIISTTSKNLKSMVDHGEFRKDLYYSLEAFSITIPPLRRRKNDIILLANYFLEKYNHLEGKEVKLDKDVYDVFTKYAWSGNVREIENVMSFIVNTHNTNQLVGIKELPNNLQNRLINDKAGQYNLEKIEKETIIKALNAFGNSTEAKKHIAKELGISNATLYRKLKKYSIIEIVQFDSQNKN